MKRTKVEALKTRESLLDAAEQVFFDLGVSRTTLERVAKTAGITRGAVYWHFKNKADLLNAVADRVRMPMENALYRLADGSGTLSDLQELCTQSLIDVYNDRRLLRVYTILLLKCEYTEEMPELIKREQSVREDVVSALTRFFSRLKKTGNNAITGEARVLAQALLAYMLGLYTSYLQSPEQFNMPGDATKLVRLFFISL